MRRNSAPAEASRSVSSTAAVRAPIAATAATSRSKSTATTAKSWPRWTNPRSATSPTRCGRCSVCSTRTEYASCSGTFDHFAAWEPALQALWFDRPIYSQATVESLVDRAGRPLDLTRNRSRWPTTVTTWRTSCARPVTSSSAVRSRPSEIDELNALIADEKANARSGDNRSWWATGADGREVCCRLTYLGLARSSDSLGWPTILDCVTSWR